MKKTSILSAFIFLFLTSTAFAQNSLVPIEMRIGNQKYTFNNSKDITVQIELREVKIDRNNSELKYINSMKNNVSRWGHRFNDDIKEYNRQIKVLEKDNKRYTEEISQLNRVLRKNYK